MCKLNYDRYGEHLVDKPVLCTDPKHKDYKRQPHYHYNVYSVPQKVGHGTCYSEDYKV